MSFSSVFQPILTDKGLLALGCYKATIGGTSIGDIEAASFTMTGETRRLEYGYPKKVKELFLDSLTANATVTCLELGAIKSLLTSIATSLATGVVPVVDLGLSIFKPAGNDLILTFSGIALLQQLSLDFTNDYNKVQFNFEQTTDTDLDSKIVVSTGSGNAFVPGELISSNNISIGFPKAGSFTAVQGVRLNVSTEYTRLEVGYPRVLKSLMPISHSVELEIDSEEFTSGAIAEVFSASSKSDIEVNVGMYDGTAVTFTLKEAMLEQSLPSNISQKEFSTLTKKFIATGDILLTIA